MSKTFGAGLLLIVAGIVALLLGSVLDLRIDSIFFGLAMGGVLALVNDGSSAFGRLGGFAVGAIVTMAAYIIRILALNESLIGQILFAVIVVVLITVICAVTGGRLPLWSGLVGAALVTGSYEASFLSAPQDITTNLFSNVSMALVPMAVAYMFGTLLRPDSPGSPDGGGDGKSDTGAAPNQPERQSEAPSHSQQDAKTSSHPPVESETSSQPQQKSEV